MNENLSERLRFLREKNGCTQAEIAGYLQIDKSTYAHYESGRRAPDAQKLRRLAEYYHLIDEILGVGSASSFAPEKRTPEREGAVLVTRFPVICPHEKIDMSRIYPTMQEKAAEIFDAMRAEERLAAIVLFGSSVTQRCHAGSDLDLAVRLRADCILPETKNDVSLRLQEATDWNADILWFDRISKTDRIYPEILKGVQIA